MLLIDQLVIYSINLKNDINEQKIDHHIFENDEYRFILNGMDMIWRA